MTLPEEGRPLKGRFAPSPTGRMHGGNIFAALVAWLIVKSTGGSMVLRIEDLDPDRSKPAFVDAVQRDFESLGLTWDEGPLFQSDRHDAYAAAFHELASQARLYPCFCTRADLAAAASAPHFGDKQVYPRTCSTLTSEDIAARQAAGQMPAIRLEVPHERMSLEDLIQGLFSQMLDEECGDFLLRRKDGAFAYQLAVVVDDAQQGITSVTRGVDLLSSTPQQIYLQRLLGFDQPVYAHVPLLVSESARRLSKRDRDASMDEMLERFSTPEGIIGHIAWITGLQPEDAPVSPEALLATFDLDDLKSHWMGKIAIPWK